LRARPLLDDQQLAALEILLRRVQQHDHLQREPFGAVQILVQAVVVARYIAQQ
jgi:hypothetical protein